MAFEKKNWYALSYPQQAEYLPLYQAAIAAGETICGHEKATRQANRDRVCDICGVVVEKFPGKAPDTVRSKFGGHFE